ncbi:hypothetical protein CEXT_171231 [Caerostris extrusa]|uniref:Uncharacterized protein n=1 Tax=Caerostris extrusa TaxID=172846 RepID=A0AAV4YFG5_CAEEX|nr:hypothetical protein CEXT_171231 [Caerostris extrusa]
MRKDDDVPEMGIWKPACQWVEEGLTDVNEDKSPRLQIPRKKGVSLSNHHLLIVTDTYIYIRIWVAAISSIIDLSSHRGQERRD